jgi:hypothetical protein
VAHPKIQLAACTYPCPEAVSLSIEQTIRSCRLEAGADFDDHA